MYKQLFFMIIFLSLPFSVHAGPGDEDISSRTIEQIEKLHAQVNSEKNRADRNAIRSKQLQKELDLLSCQINAIPHREIISIFYNELNKNTQDLYAIDGRSIAIGRATYKVSIDIAEHSGRNFVYLKNQKGNSLFGQPIGEIMEDATYSAHITRANVFDIMECN